jgi:hypothetical protein
MKKTLDEPSHHFSQGGDVSGIILQYTQINPMTLVAIFHSKRDPLPVVMEVPTYGKFIDCCGTFATDWGHLMNKESGEILQTWRNYE